MPFLIVDRGPAQVVVWSSSYRTDRHGEHEARRWWPGLEYAKEFRTRRAAEEEIRERAFPRAEIVRVTVEVRRSIVDAKRRAGMGCSDSRRRGKFGAYDRRPKMLDDLRPRSFGGRSKKSLRGTRRAATVPSSA